MLGDLDLMQCAQKDAPTMRRLSVELSHGSAAHAPGGSGAAAGQDILPGGARSALRRLSTSSVTSSRSSMSQDSSLSPTFSSSLPNSFYLDRVNNLLGRTASLPAGQQQQGGLPSIPPSPSAGAGGLPGLPTSPLRLATGAPVEPSTRVTALIRSLSKGMDSFR